MTYHALASLLDLLDSGVLDQHRVITWAAPVPSFGSAATSAIATVGINPSYREFVDIDGTELRGEQRRLPTLSSLGLARWGHADHPALFEIVEACAQYFRRRPYDRWFGVLERIIRPMGSTFYGERPNACHLDLVPYATHDKWGELAPAVRTALTAYGTRAMGYLLRDSDITVVLLNGRSVIRLVEAGSDWIPNAVDVPQWGLRRTAGRTVPGMAYSGSVGVVGGVELSRRVQVYGWNHNLQSSYGVTTDVVDEIAAWVASQVKGDVA